MGEITRFFPGRSFLSGGLVVASATGPSVVALLFLYWWIQSGQLVPYFQYRDLGVLVLSLLYALLLSLVVFILLIGPAALLWAGAGLLAGHPIDLLSRGGAALAIGIAFVGGLTGALLMIVIMFGGGSRGSMNIAKLLATQPQLMSPGPIAALWAWWYMRWLHRQTPTHTPAAAEQPVRFSRVSKRSAKRKASRDER